MMFNHKYDYFLAKHTVSIFFEQAHFLMSIDCFDKNTFSRISMISSIPHDNRSFNIPEGMINNLVKELNEKSKVDVKLKNAQLKGSRGYDLESGVYEFDIYDKKTKKTYRRTTKKEWKELD